MRWLLCMGTAIMISFSALAQVDTGKAKTEKVLPEVPSGIQKLAPDTKKNMLYNASPYDKAELQKRGFEFMQFYEEFGKDRAAVFKSNEEIKIIIETPEENLPSGQRIVNGPTQYDSRVELRSLDPSRTWVKGVLKNARSVAVVISKSKIRKVSKSFYQIDDSNTLGKLYQLCPGEPFRNEPVLGTGTAIVTGKREMLTAGHVFEGPLDQYAVIFGFEITTKAGGYETIIPADSVYFPVKISRQSLTLDIAYFSVDRDLHAPELKWSSEVNPQLNEEVYMIGYPYGLPEKVAANASVINNKDQAALSTSLDAFQGNSGSPVFSLKTDEVIGILVSGNVDYQWNGSCNVSAICAAPYCDGERAIRVSTIKSQLGRHHSQLRSAN